MDGRVNQVEKFRLNNNFTYLLTGLLFFFFIFMLVFVVLPNLPRYPENPGMQRTFVSLWNFACTIMWVMVLRIQVLHKLSDIVERKKSRRNVTPWVKFWFAASMLIGSVTIVYVLHNYAVVPAGSSALPFDLMTITSIAAWVALVALAISLFSVKKCSRKMLPHITDAKNVHRLLLTPSSVLFFFATFMFPIFFIL